MKRVLSLGLVMFFGFASLSFGKILQKELKEGEYEIIIIQKGDTLWDLAGRYVGKCWQWPSLEDRNKFTDPHWIYPGEKLAIGIKDGRVVIKKPSEIEEDLKAQLARTQAELKKKEAELAKMKEEMEKMKVLSREEMERLLSEKEAELAKLSKEKGVSGELIDQLKEEIDQLKKEIARLKGKPAEVEVREKEIIKEVVSPEEKAKREKLESDVSSLKEESYLLKKGMEELARKLSATESRLGRTEGELSITEGRLVETEQVVVAKDKEIAKVTGEKEVIAKEEKVQRRYKEVVAVGIFMGIVLMNSLK
jgi:chromosome segregation ATPase